MGYVRYMISEACRKVDVEAHVLRYWEEELELPIARNEMGHRYYKESDIHLLSTVKQLKEQGFQLKAVKMLLPNLDKIEKLDKQAMVVLKNKLEGKAADMWDEENVESKEGENGPFTGEVSEEVSGQANEKLKQFKSIMSNIIASALKESQTQLTEEISANVTEGVIREMDYLMRVQEEREEDRYKRFDATLRDYQKSKIMAAASLEGKGRRKSKFFRKNKVYI